MTWTFCSDKSLNLFDKYAFLDCLRPVSPLRDKQPSDFYSNSSSSSGTSDEEGLSEAKSPGISGFLSDFMIAETSVGLLVLNRIDLVQLVSIFTAQSFGLSN